MAAPEGNQFWKLRSKHGRDKLFETPELLWEAACEYFEWVEANPLIEIDFKTVDKVLEEIRLPKMRPFTMHGLCLYLDCGTAYFRQFKDTKKEGFSTVIEKIEETIYNQKFEGASAGFLNANIIARDLGLADKQDINGNFKVEQITGMQFK